MLRSLIALLETRRTFNNALPPPSSQAAPAKEFIREGERKTKDETGSWCLSDLNQRLSFPADITTTNLRPDPVLWSSSLHMTHIVKLTVALEDAVEETVECKSLKYRELAADAEQLGYYKQGFAGRSRLQKLCGKVSNQAVVDDPPWRSCGPITETALKEGDHPMTPPSQLPLDKPIQDHPRSRLKCWSHTRNRTI